MNLDLEQNQSIYLLGLIILIILINCSISCVFISKRNHFIPKLYIETMHRSL